MADQNTLRIGESRLGQLFDDDPATPLVTALLENDGNRITLRVPWERDGHGGPYRRWFSGSSIRWGDDPDQTRFKYRVPEILWFDDPRGPVALVGCRSLGSQSLVGGAGEGIVGVTFAVIGGRGDYRKINGLRTELPGLADWIGLRAVTSKVEQDSSGRVTAFELKASSPEALRLDRRMNMRVHANWRTSGAEADTTAVVEALQVETKVATPRRWEEHLALHQIVRDLLDVAAWELTPYSSLYMHRVDDPHTAMSGRIVGDQWVPVHTRSLRSSGDHPARREYLFRFDDIGVAGFRRWARLHKDFRRGLGPMLALLDLRSAHVETRIAQSGVALEAIGYSLALEAGASARTAGKEPHAKRLERIASELPTGALQDVIPDLAGWIAQSNDAYNGVKHANRVLPNPIDLLNAERENEIVFRAWVSTRIGLADNTLRQRLRSDHLAAPYKPA